MSKRVRPRMRKIWEEQDAEQCLRCEKLKNAELVLGAPSVGAPRGAYIARSMALEPVPTPS